MFSQPLLAALRHNDNANSDNQSDYLQAAAIIENAVNNQFNITWDRLITVFSALARFVDDRRSRFQRFEQDYVASSSTQESWADPRFRSILRISNLEMDHGRSRQHRNNMIPTPPTTSRKP